MRLILMADLQGFFIRVTLNRVTISSVAFVGYEGKDEENKDI
jgi:hypothetical protein